MHRKEQFFYLDVFSVLIFLERLGFGLEKAGKSSVNILPYLIMRFFYFAIILFFCGGSIFPNDSFQKGLVSARHKEGTGIGYSKGYTTAEGLYGVSPSSCHFAFIDARFHVFNDGKFASNTGLGYRFEGEYASFGLNGYFDTRCQRDHTYFQIGPGVEVLSTWLDLRANGYFPIGNKSRLLSERFDGFSNHSILLTSEFRHILKGGDVEIGRCLFACRNLNAYAGIGGYHYSYKKNSTKLGGKIRLNAGVANYCSLHFQTSYDRKFRTRVEGGISFNFPFCSRKKCCRSTLEINTACCIIPPVRQEILVTSREQTKKLAGDICILHVDNTSIEGNGTFENPFPTLKEAETQSDSNFCNVIYVHYGDGTTSGMENGFIMKPNQRLLGSGFEYSIRSLDGYFTLPPLDPGLYPSITNLAGVGVLANDMTEISGLNIVGSSSHGIEIGSHNIININNDLVSMSGGNGVFINPTNIDSNASIIGTSIIQNGLEGVLVDASGGNYSFLFNNTTISENGLEGILINASNAQAQTTITGSTVVQNVLDGVDISVNDGDYSFTFENNNVRENGRNGFTFETMDNQQFEGSFRNNTIAGNATRGVDFISTNENADLIFSNNIFDGENLSADGLQISVSANSTSFISALISGNQFLNHLSEGVDVRENTNSAATFDVQILNNDFQNNDIGIQIEGDSSGSSLFNLLISQNSLTNQISRSIDIGMRGDDVIDLELSNNNIAEVTSGKGIEFTLGNDSSGKARILANSTTQASEEGIRIVTSSDSELAVDFQENNVFNNGIVQDLLIQARNSSEICLRAIGNFTDQTARFDRFGASNIFRVESPNGAASGVESENSFNAFVTDATFFVPTPADFCQTCCE
ncbi:MAG: right-handed parallel beta-helix repeat-containing protein [Simkaniaceae bacterium]|nr:right-handed parallel beta-helix repeat-containing protein [Candidatus Sacchlamyda saccharinae]